MSLRFIYRSCCSLCDAMWAELNGWLGERLQDGSGDAVISSIERLDLTDHPALESQYGHRVPVLEAGSTELCGYFFDVDAVEAYLSGLSNPV